VTRKEYAIQMQRKVSREGVRIGEQVDPLTARGAELKARWWWWFSRYSANPGEQLRFAKSHIRLSRDMAARPHEYEIGRREPGQSAWQVFQSLLARDERLAVQEACYE